jgi:translocation and assembly module TamB
VPLASLNAAFALGARELVLDAMRAELAGNGQVTGRAVIPLDGSASRWQFAVRDLDLRRLHGKLVATRLAGTLSADVAQGKQVVQGELGQTDLSLSFAATIAGSAVNVERFRGRAGTGAITGRGHGSLDGNQAFDLAAQLTRLDPARFGAFPAGSLDGSVTLRGVVAPRWRVDTEATIAPGSRLEGLALAGHARGQATAGALRDVAAALTLASARVEVDGNVGTSGDVLHYDIDVDKLADMRSLLAQHAGFPVPEALAGAVHARGSFTSEPGGNGINLDLSASALRWGSGIALKTLAAKTTIGAGGLTLDAAANTTRSFALDVSATGVHVPQGELATASASVTGTLAHHTAIFAFKGNDIDTQVRATGGIPSRTGAAAGSAQRWSGTLEQLTNRGTYALTLEAPTPIEWGAGLLHIGTARVAVADGHADLADFLWDNGRITTRGAFGGIPVVAVARLAGTRLPLATTLVVGGDWALAASPRLNGTLRVFREGGDIFGTDVLSPNHADLALGVTTLTIDAHFVDDGVDATAALRSLRAGNADARLTVVAPANASIGHVARNALVTASLTADLASLKPLQPWLATTAVMDGSAHVELAAHGTLDALKLTGTFRGDDVRVDLPQYGVNLTQGRLRAHIADERVVLDELTFTGGDGRFTAQGTLARATGDGAADAAPLGRLTWSATRFRVANRPDFHLVASGSGFVAAENGKLTLQGTVDIDQGRIDYAPSTAGTLGSDIVVVGRPPRTDARGTAIDLALDIDVGLGSDLRFTGGGFDTGLTGRLRVSTSRSGTLVARGTIRAVNGTYFAFGQRLDIDRGQLIFDGPADNPALDVVALRRNLAVEAGVEVTGTVSVPRVRLVSNPPVPDGEKLSWLVTGQGLDRASRADLAALGAASASLLGAGQRPLSTTIANSLGLDDISLRSSSNATSTSGTSSQVVAFGKRISDRLTLVYEQGLTVATNALRIEYTLSRTLTLRAEAGVVSSLGLFFRRTYD